jgi:hypothetical protein
MNRCYNVHLGQNAEMVFPIEKRFINDWKIVK